MLRQVLKARQPNLELEAALISPFQVLTGVLAPIIPGSTTELCNKFNLLYTHLHRRVKDFEDDPKHTRIQFEFNKYCIYCLIREIKHKTLNGTLKVFSLRFPFRRF